jgi:DNA-binding PadR family transcriptional regulator
MDLKTLNILKELERSGTVPIILALNQLKEGKFTDIHYESIRMGFRVGSGVVSRRLDRLCALGWVQKVKNERGSKTFILTEDGFRVAKAIKELIRILETHKLE